MLSTGCPVPSTSLKWVGSKILMLTMASLSLKFQLLIGSKRAKATHQDGCTWKGRASTRGSRRSASPLRTTNRLGRSSTRWVVPLIKMWSGSGSSALVTLTEKLGMPSLRKDCLLELLMKNSKRKLKMIGLQTAIFPVWRVIRLLLCFISIPVSSFTRTLSSQTWERRMKILYPSQLTTTKLRILSGRWSGSRIAPCISSWRKRLSSFSENTASRIVKWFSSVWSSKKDNLCIRFPSQKRILNFLGESPNCLYA